MESDRRVATWAAAHHSLITRAVALECGLTTRQIRHRVRSGRWDELHPGVYVIAGIPLTDRMALAAATLAVPGAASHRSAGWLLHLLRTAPPRPEITASITANHRHDRIHVHRSRDLVGRDIQRVDGIPCTNAIRTCIDLGACLSPEQLEAVIERARNDRLVHLDPLIARFLQLARRGRDGIATTRLVLQRIDPALEPAESDLETLLLRVLRERHLPSPVRQHEVRIEGRRFRLDLCYPPQRLAIESDGFASHGTRTAFEDDRERQNLLVLDGWRILRFTWRQVCTDPDSVAEQVRAALELAS